MNIFCNIITIKQQKQMNYSFFYKFHNDILKTLFESQVFGRRAQEKIKVIETICSILL